MKIFLDKVGFQTGEEITNFLLKTRLNIMIEHLIRLKDSNVGHTYINYDNRN